MNKTIKSAFQILAVTIIMLAFTACNQTVDGIEYKLVTDAETGESTYTVVSYTEDTSVTEVSGYVVTFDYVG